MVAGTRTVLGSAELAIANDVPLARSGDRAMLPVPVEALARAGGPLVRVASDFVPHPLPSLRWDDFRRDRRSCCSVLAPPPLPIWKKPAKQR
jgi:hypothetical protein